MKEKEFEDVGFLENLQEKEQDLKKKNITRPENSQFECEGCGS